MRNAFTRQSDTHSAYTAQGRLCGLRADVDADHGGNVVLSMGPVFLHLTADEALDVARALAEAVRATQLARVSSIRNAVAQIEAHTALAIQELAGADLERPASHLRKIMDEISQIRDRVTEELPASPNTLEALEGIANKAYDALRRHDRAGALTALFRVHLALIQLRNALEAAQ